jgi:hypothetical protein
MDEKTRALADALAAMDSLDMVARISAREQMIREAMTETGEDRATVEDLLDALVSMGQEAVLDLVEGEPTTLDAALQRYVEELEGRDELQPRDRVVEELSLLLNYPWPGEAPAASEVDEIRPDPDLQKRV